MSKVFEELLLRISSDLSLLRGVEEATKQGVVLPILSELGWNCFNVNEVSPEYSVGNGRVDYCLQMKQKSMVFIEVKRASENLERHERQLLNYSFERGIDLAVLTNGLTWWFYLPMEKGGWDERKFFSIDITKQKVSHLAKYFTMFLNRANVLDGAAIVFAKRIKKGREKNTAIKKAIPNAWNQLIEEPDELLLEIFSERVESISGYEPEIQQLVNYLNKTVSGEALDNKVSTKPFMQPRPGKSTPSTNIQVQKGTTITIDGRTIIGNTVKEIYLQALMYLYDKGYIDSVQNQIPYPTSNRRYLIAKSPIHQRGNSFRAPIEYNNYYMETHKNYTQAIKQLEDFVVICGLKMHLNT